MLLRVEKIKKIYTTAGKYKDIALIFNVHEDTVSKIKNRGKFFSFHFFYLNIKIF